MANEQQRSPSAELRLGTGQGHEEPKAEGSQG